MLYQKMAAATGALVLLSTVSAAWDWKEEAREKIQHVFSGDKTLDVDQVSGSIHVLGDGGTTIRVEGEKILRASTKEALARAKRDVTLDINEKDGIAHLYVNGPFRNHSRNGDSHSFHERRDHDYEVEYNFTIHVPRETILRLRTVNGAASAEGTRGAFDIQSVNGAVTMADAGGSGKATTVNGSLTVAFRESPKAPSEFKTVNGRVEATFPANLAADLRFKTLNGATYSDFDVKPVATAAEPGERRNRRFVYKANRMSSVRVGAGGPKLSFETVNGAITIKKGIN